MDHNFEYHHHDDDLFEFNRPQNMGRSTRLKAGRPGEIEFQGDLGAKRQKLAQDIEYLREPPKKRAQVRARPVAVKPAEVKLWVVYIGWVICGLMLLRLTFMEKGLIDYLRMKNTLEEKKSEFASIEKENKAILSEINRIQTDEKYQRRLAREHLGVIAQDEFLILFAREKELLTKAEH